MDNSTTNLTHSECKIEKVNVIDLRVPTSDTLLGSDPFHKKTELLGGSHNNRNKHRTLRYISCVHCWCWKRLDRLWCKRPRATYIWNGIRNLCKRPRCVPSASH